jgi:hypothetical protein
VADAQTFVTRAEDATATGAARVVLTRASETAVFVAAHGDALRMGRTRKALGARTDLAQAIHAAALARATARFVATFLAAARSVAGFEAARVEDLEAHLAEPALATQLALTLGSGTLATCDERLARSEAAEAEGTFAVLVTAHLRSAGVLDDSRPRPVFTASKRERDDP